MHSTSYYKKGARMGKTREKNKRERKARKAHRKSKASSQTQRARHSIRREKKKGTTQTKSLRPVAPGKQQERPSGQPDAVLLAEVSKLRRALEGVIVATEGSRWKDAKEANRIASEALS